MARGLADAIKRTSIQAMDNAQMCDLRYGTVVSVSPLRVQITNQFTIPETLLVIPQHLTDYKVDVTISWTTNKSGIHQHTYEGATDSESDTFSGTVEEGGEHSHGISGKKTMLIHGALQVGDKVALLRKQGGQSYYILDRI